MQGQGHYPRYCDPRQDRHFPTRTCILRFWVCTSAQRVVGVDPPAYSHPMPYARRAAAYSKLGNYAGAVQDCERAIRIDPTYSKAYGRMG